MPKTLKSAEKCDFSKATRRIIYKNKKSRLGKGLDIYDLKYNEPTKKDLAIGLVYFNCVKSKRLIMNYLYVREKLRIADIPTYTIEMYEGTPEIHDAIHLKTDFILFQKERLCHLLEKHIPSFFKKLMFIDCDLVFDNLRWYDDVSKKLDHFNIVQPFSNALWLDITYKKIVKERIPFVFYKKFGNISEEGGIGGYHPGFAWAFQRDWFRKVGFFQESILGDGDTISSTLWLNYENFQYKPYLNKAVMDFKSSLNVLPTMCFIDGNVYHLWHGDQRKRQYRRRRLIFKDVSDIRDILKTDENGLYMLKDGSLKEKIRKYFTNRDDDGLPLPVD